MKADFRKIGLLKNYYKNTHQNHVIRKLQTLFLEQGILKPGDVEQSKLRSNVKNTDFRHLNSKMKKVIFG